MYHSPLHHIRLWGGEEDSVHSWALFPCSTVFCSKSNIHLRLESQAPWILRVSMQDWLSIPSQLQSGWTPQSPEDHFSTWNLWHRTEINTTRPISWCCGKRDVSRERQILPLLSVQFIASMLNTVDRSPPKKHHRKMVEKRYCQKKSKWLSLASFKATGNQSKEATITH